MYKCQAYSLLEILVTIVVICTIIFFGSAYLAPIYSNHQLTVVAQSIKRQINSTRLQSALKGQTLILCPINHNWSDGIMICNTDQFYGKKQTCEQYHWQRSSVKVSWKGFQNDKALIFKPNIANNELNGLFIIYNPYKTIKLTLNRFGRLKLIR